MTAHTVQAHVADVAWDDPRAAAMRAEMDAELGPRYADRLENVPQDQAALLTAALALNPADIAATIIATVEGQPVGHAALRKLAGVEDALEVKRVYVAPSARGTGVSRALMAELERIAHERGVRRLILQTGDRQPDAVVLYERIGYTRIPVFEPYTPITFSQCFEKVIG